MIVNIISYIISSIFQLDTASQSGILAINYSFKTLLHSRLLYNSDRFSKTIFLTALETGIKAQTYLPETMYNTKPERLQIQQLLQMVILGSKLADLKKVDFLLYLCWNYSDNSPIQLGGSFRVKLQQRNR